jgi:prophage regulatory protein
MGDRLIAYEELRAKGIPFSKPHIWRLEKQGRFPKRIYIGNEGGRSSYAWSEAEIDAHIEKLIEKRDANRGEW